MVKIEIIQIFLLHSSYKEILYLFQTMYGVLSPCQFDMDRLDAISQINRKREEEIGGPAKADDHPMLIEIRRRMVGAVLEAVQVNFF